MDQPPSHVLLDGSGELQSTYINAMAQCHGGRLPDPLPFDRRFLLSGVRKRSFRKGVLGGTCLVFPGTLLFASETEKEHPKELRGETPFPKRLFRTL